MKITSIKLTHAQFESWCAKQIFATPELKNLAALISLKLKERDREAKRGRLLPLLVRRQLLEDMTRMTSEHGF